MSFIEKITGSIEEKKRFKTIEARAKVLPKEYAHAYKEIRNYLWNTSGIVTIDPLGSLVDLLEEAAARKQSVTDITGPDVASFADELVKGEPSWRDAQREKLHRSL